MRGYKSLPDFFESSLALLIPVPMHLLLQQLVQWVQKRGEVRYETPIVVKESVEGPQLTHVLRNTALVMACTLLSRW